MIRDLELNCDYIPKDTLNVSDFKLRLDQPNAVYFTSTYGRSEESSLGIKLNRADVKVLRKWLKQWLKDTK